MDKTIDLAAVALDYGPFLFAILFVTGLTALAQRAYAEAEDPDERKTFRTYFFVSFFFGLVLVSVCVAWWIYDRVTPQRFVYTVDIQNVPAPVRFLSTEACVSQFPITIGSQQLQEVRAIFVEDKRLQPGHKLLLEEMPQGGVGKAPQPLHDFLNPDVRIDYSDLRDTKVASGRNSW